MKKLLSIVLALIMLLGLAGCSNAPSVEDVAADTVIFTDSVGRSVRVDANITAVAPSGAVAQMILLTLAPELLIGLSGNIATEQREFFPKYTYELPTFGQFYGSRANLNMEALISAAPQVIIDLGDIKNGIADDMDMVQQQTGIPTVFIDASLDKLPDAYRSLGALLNRQERAEQLAAFIDETLAMVSDNSAKVQPNEVKTVLFGTGESGLACNAKGSSQSDTIELVGAENAIVPEIVTSRGGGTLVNLETVYAAEPDAILLAKGGPYNELKTNEWSALKAVQADCYYEIPNLPYDWMSTPPSVNRVLGLWWLGRLLYPQYYDYDVKEVAKRFYKLFWNYELKDAQLNAMLANSILK